MSSINKNKCAPEPPLGPTNVVPYNSDIAYNNKGTEPWNHHSISSIQQDPKILFKKAYYYEFDNATYESSLKKALVVPCALMADAVKSSNWGKEIDPIKSTSATSPYVIDAYNACITYVYQKVNAAPSMVLPGDPTPATTKVQIVHDVLKWYKMHTVSKDMYLIDMELIMYRENKAHGKHVHATCTAKQSSDKKGWVVNVVAVEVIGVLSEDQIALFPVVPSNPFDISQLNVDEDTNMSTKVDYKVKDTANSILATQHRNQWTQVALSSKKISAYATSSQSNPNKIKVSLSDQY
jgi:hypothetical protein